MRIGMDPEDTGIGDLLSPDSQETPIITMATEPTSRPIPEEGQHPGGGV
jgi:hypothetical protein